MKRVIACALLAVSALTTSVWAEPENMRQYDMAATFGATSVKNDGGVKLKNGTFGFSFQMNNYTVKPRFDFEYVRVTDKDTLINGFKKADEVNSLIKGSINGIYEMPNTTNFFPYGLVGVGYEHVTDETQGFESHPFIQGGVGAGYRFRDNSFVLRFEARLLQILGGDTIQGKSEDNEVITTLSFAVPFGKILNEKPAIDLVDSDGDGVMDRFDKCPNTPKGTRVDGSGCPLPEMKTEIIKETITSLSGEECPVKIDGPDRDRDGVPDDVDQCPNTPCDFSVDDKGCPVKANLMIHFATDKAEITPESRPLVKKFAEFLIRNKGSLVHIIGHTDWRGSDQYNMALSKRRAKAVRDALIEYGVSASRLSTEGRGEREPIASNKTPEGMALNRRTEVHLTYPQYIDAGEK
jgi:OOP family OmpA-OmpF porin